MKMITKMGFLALMVGALVFAMGGSALALHSASSLVCMECHTMHASENGSNTGVTPGNGFVAAPAGGVTAGGNPNLLLQANVTDLCLQCHAEGVNPAGHGPEVMSETGNPANAYFGGDFYTSTLIHTGDAGVGGEGHNPYYTPGTQPSSTIMPADENLADPLLPPGGAAPLTRWDCVSCHAPHQNDVSPVYGTANPTFRMLWSKPAGLGSDVTFNAVEGSTSLGPPDYLPNPESDTNHSGYQGNVSAWCGQCHGTFHTNAGTLLHPSDENIDSGTGIYALYNGNPAAGANYSFIVPVEDPAATNNTDFAATTSSKVMCLSCHRAHAASTVASHPDYTDATLINNTRNMTRWDMERASGSGLGCNKCHDKGE